MKNLIKHLSCLLMVLLAGIAFASCGDDNDDDEQQSLLVGTWELTYEDCGYWYTDRMILSSSGGGKGIEDYATNDPDCDPEPYTFRWSYNESTHILTIIEDDMPDDDSDTYYYYVSEINDDYAVLYDYEYGKVDYDDRTVWYRVK